MIMKYHGPRLPSKTAVKAQLDFLEFVDAETDYIKQCDDCVHSFNAEYDNWCDKYPFSPTGICVHKSSTSGTMREVKKMKIYIAARFSARSRANFLARILSTQGHVITSRWCNGGVHIIPVGISKQASDSERKRFALEDLEDLDSCDWCISLTEIPRSNSRGGRHVEFGYAIALDKKLTIIGHRETVFHHLPQVEHFETFNNFVDSL